MNTHKITNKTTGAVLEGMLVYKLARSFYFIIEGAKSGNTFQLADWDIEELPKPVELPTEPGYYKGGRNLYELHDFAGWVLVGIKHLSHAEMEERVEADGPLVRLVPEITEVTNEMVEAYVEAYAKAALGATWGSSPHARRAGILAAIKAARR